MKKKKQSQLKESLQYLKLSKKPIYFIALLFLFTIIIGYSYAFSLSGLLTPFLKELVDKTENLNPLELILFIFQNNAITSFLAVASGIFLGIFPLIITITNGIILGYVIERTTQLASFTELWRLFPHGIFELPAVFISLGLGIKLGYEAPLNYFKYYWKNNRKLVWLPFLITIPIIAFIISALASGLFNDSRFNQSPLIPLSAIIICAFYFALVVLIFILFTAVTNKKLGKIQLKAIKHSISGTLRVFFFIVIPLLIIAAIIEGLLISIM